MRPAARHISLTFAALAVTAFALPNPAATILSDNGRVEVSVSDGLGGTDADTDFRDSGSGRTRATRDITVGTYSAFAQADSQSPPIAPPPSNPDPDFVGWTLATLRINRATNDVDATGFARPEPSRAITFRLDEGVYDITYRIAGSADITNEQAGNTSLAGATIALVNQSQSALVLNEQGFTQDAVGFDRSGVMRFAALSDDVFALTVEASVTGDVAGAETAAQIDAIVEFEITVIPEPASGVVLATSVALLMRRRRSGR